MCKSQVLFNSSFVIFVQFFFQFLRDWPFFHIDPINYYSFNNQITVATFKKPVKVYLNFKTDSSIMINSFQIPNFQNTVYPARLLPAVNARLLTARRPTRGGSSIPPATPPTIPLTPTARTRWRPRPTSRSQSSSITSKCEPIRGTRRPDYICKLMSFTMR